MKKMNLIFHTRGIQGVISRGLMIFTMLFLFGFGFNTLSAQYVSTDQALENLTNANIEIMESMEALQQSGNTVALDKASLKQTYLRAMLMELKLGATVSETVRKFIVTDASEALTGKLDYQLGGNGKSDETTWLKDEILELLEL